MFMHCFTHVHFLLCYCPFYSCSHLCGYNYINQLFYLRKKHQNEHLLTHTAISQKSLTLNISLKFNIPLTVVCLALLKQQLLFHHSKFLRYLTVNCEQWNISGVLILFNLAGIFSIFYIKNTRIVGIALIIYGTLLLATATFFGIPGFILIAIAGIMALKEKQVVKESK